jgi:hypothetical protein
MILCKYCHRELKNKESIKLGYGPSCFKKHKKINNKTLDDYE